MGKMNAEQVNESFQTFCNGTSMHGFAELFNAKNVFWKVFWLILLMSAIGLTTYQVIGATNQFLDESTSSKSELIKRNDFYPPIKICLMHWVYWVDWEKAFSMGFTKETVLYGMSYLTPIYTSNGSFDVKMVKENFLITMALNNFTKLHQFYRSIAKPLPIWYSSVNNGTMLFDHIHMSRTKWMGTLMCYSTSSETVLESLKDKHEISFGIKTLTITSSYLTINEYNWYMTEWLVNTSMSYIDNNDGQIKDFTNYTLPLVLYADGYSEDYLQTREADDDYYTITMSVVVNQWIPDTNGYQCLFNQRGIVSNTTSLDTCKMMYTEKILCKCNPFETAILSNTDEPERICQHEIYLLSPENIQNPMPLLSANNVLFTWGASGDDNNCSTNVTALKLQKSCISSIVPPCEQWEYKLSTAIEKYSSPSTRSHFTKLGTSFRINYPTELIFKMVQIERQTWEDFVANIGGLLGVWTGASLMSIVQLFYLCCYNRMEYKSKKMNNVSIFTKSDVSSRKNEM